jgi:hypothetical protein
MCDPFAHYKEDVNSVYLTKVYINIINFLINLVDKTLINLNKARIT